LGGTVSCRDFQSALKFLTKHYTPVSLQEVLSSFDGEALPPRPVLVTFDDAYASVSEFAAPLCAEFGVPAVVFVNAAYLDNRELALDNLICYVVNVFGLDPINRAIRSVQIGEHSEVRSLTEIFSLYLPSISLETRRAFQSALRQMSGINEFELALKANLYLTSQQLRDLAGFDFEIGDHTYTHVNCRSLLLQELTQEIDQNRMALEAISGTKVRGFSVPYGSSADLTNNLLAHLYRSGYQAVFLAEGSANSAQTDRWHLNRISITTVVDSALFTDIEILPRLRRLRNKVRQNSTSEFARTFLQPLHLGGDNSQ
jgi:peptidoglycan/xylan/chitin deacetylase (PgdA/CDA1 family)